MGNLTLLFLTFFVMFCTHDYVLDYAIRHTKKIKKVRTKNVCP